jgi:hypothetical protein
VYKYALLFVGLVLLLSGCSTVTVKTDYDRDVDFSRYQTYSWFPVAERPGRGLDRPLNNSLLEARVKREVARQIEAKGLRFVDGQADIRITYHLGLQNRVDVEKYGYRPWGRRGPGRRVTEVHRYKEGTLILDFIDPKRKRLVWRGWAKSALPDPELADEKVRQTVEVILDQYPPD